MEPLQRCGGDLAGMGLRYKVRIGVAVVLRQRIGEMRRPAFDQIGA